VVADEAHDGEDEACHGRAMLERDLATGAARQPRTVSARDLERDLRAGVAGADHEDCPVAQLGRVPVVARVQLDDLSVQILGELGNTWRPIGPGGDDDVIGFEPPIAVLDHVPPISPGQASHPDTGSSRHLEAVGVGLQMVGHLVLGREGVP
jgi:hypothetical protein